MVHGFSPFLSDITMLTAIPFLMFLSVIGYGFCSAQKGKEYKKYSEPSGTNLVTHESVTQEEENAKTLSAKNTPKTPVNGLLMHKLSVSGMMPGFSLVCNSGDITGIFYDRKDPIGICLARIISGQMAASSGYLSLQGHKLSSLTKYFWHFCARSYFKNFGFCSKEVLPLPYLTGRGMLNYAATTKGIKNKEAEVAYWANKLMIHEDILLTQCCDMLAAEKTKISIACALLGRPPVIVLHEPFHGLEADLFMRTTLMTCLTELATDEKSHSAVLILSSYIPEDMKHACTRIGFAYYSKLRWILPPQELVKRACKLLYIKLDLDNSKLSQSDYNNEIDLLMEDMMTKFPKSNIVEETPISMTYETTFDYETIGSLYTIMEELLLKHIICFQDYQVSNPTLQDIAIYKTMPLGAAELAEETEQRQSKLKSESAASDVNDEVKGNEKSKIAESKSNIKDDEEKGSNKKKGKGGSSEETEENEDKKSKQASKEKEEAAPKKGKETSKENDEATPKKGKEKKEKEEEAPKKGKEKKEKEEAPKKGKEKKEKEEEAPKKGKEKKEKEEEAPKKGKEKSKGNDEATTSKGKEKKEKEEAPKKGKETLKKNDEAAPKKGKEPKKKEEGASKKGKETSKKNDEAAPKKVKGASKESPESGESAGAAEKKKRK